MHESVAVRVFVSAVVAREIDGVDAFVEEFGGIG